MSKHQCYRAAAVLAALALLAGCGTTISGQARAGAPTTGTTQQQGAQLDPCTLLTPKQAGALGLVRNGKPMEGNLDKRSPHGCLWEYADEERTGSLSVTASTKLSLAEWVGGKPPNDEFQLGGLTWKRFPSIFGKSNCTLGVDLGENSFVGLMSSNLDDPSKACELATKAAPLVAAHLPGGNPNPTLPAPTTSAPPSPLVGMEPCALLSKVQLEKLGVSPEGRKTGKGRSSTDLPPGCEWEQTANHDLVVLYVMFFLDRTIEEASYDHEPTGEFTVGERKWIMFKGYDDQDWRCKLLLPVTETSSVLITGGNKGDPTNACAQLKQAAKMMTPEIPKG